MKSNFFDFTLSELEVWLKNLGKQRFRAQQLFRWVYGLRTLEIDKMTNLSLKVREELKNLMRFELPELVMDRTSQDGTRKFLFKVGSGKFTIESVLIPSGDRLTLCVSSEVGCNMACQFCYTGKQKLKRRLTVSEIIGQLLHSQIIIGDAQRITNVVFMGMGEPLDNCDNVFKAIEIMHSSWGMNLSRKKITVSTSGLVEQIPKVTEAGVRLAVSLNAVDNETRNKIMPINRKWPIEDLLEACREHARATKDKITMEYVLLKGVTDSIGQARQLHRLTKKVPCKINIIPFNEHPNSGFFRPEESQVQAFQNELMRLGSHVLRRKTMGRDIYAACGQLTSSPVPGA